MTNKYSIIVPNNNTGATTCSIGSHGRSSSGGLENQEYWENLLPVLNPRTPEQTLGTPEPREFQPHCGCCHSEFGSVNSEGPRSLCSEPQAPSVERPSFLQAGPVHAGKPRQTQDTKGFQILSLRSFTDLEKNTIVYQTECFITRSLEFKSISVGLYWFVCCWVNFF